MLKTSESTESKTQPGEGGVGIDASRAKCDGSRLDRNRIDDGEVNDNEVRDNKVRKKVQKLSKSKNLSKKMVGSDFCTHGAKLAFTKLRQTFVKSSILYHFNSECHIQIETDASGYTIDRVFSQLNLDDLGWWYLVAFFLQKMILAETRYETHDSELLAIVEALKT